METDFAEWLSNELKIRRMSQVDLANKSGITPAQISRILSGQRGAEGKTLAAIAKALKLPPDLVFRQAGLLPPEPSQDDWAERMDHKIRLIPPRLRGVAEGVIDSMLAGEEAEQAARPKTKSART